MIFLHGRSSRAQIWIKKPLNLVIRSWTLFALSSSYLNNKRATMSSTNHLRALQPLMPMNASQSPEDEDEDEEFTYAVYESPCIIKASNDEFTPQEIDAFEPCTTDFYGGCVEEAAILDTDSTIKILDVAFDYELYYSVGSNITRTLAFFEGIMLEHISAITGLTECDNRRLDVPILVDRRLPEYHDFSDEELSLFSGLTSAPLDQVDTDIGEEYDTRVFVIP